MKNKKKKYSKNNLYRLYGKKGKVNEEIVTKTNNTLISNNLKDISTNIKRVADNSEKYLKNRENRNINRKMPENAFLKLPTFKRVFHLITIPGYLAILSIIFLMYIDKTDFLTTFIEKIKYSEGVFNSYIVLNVYLIFFGLMLILIRGYIAKVGIKLFMVLYYWTVINLSVGLLFVTWNKFILIEVEVAIIYMFFFLVTYIILTTYNVFLYWLSTSENIDRYNLVKLTFIIAVLSLLVSSFRLFH